MNFSSVVDIRKAFDEPLESECMRWKRADVPGVEEVWKRKAMLRLRHDIKSAINIVMLIFAITKADWSYD